MPDDRVSSHQDDPTLPPENARGATKDAPVAGDGGRHFGDYELLAEIARGGMGVVYKARERKLNRLVALKMILAGQLAGESEVQRFYAEAEAAANLDHPGIVPIFEIGENHGQHYFSMAYVDGASLAQKVAAGPLPPKEAAELTKKVAEAIAYAHDKGVIHRDLKPANVLLDAQGEPKVTDFGLAKKLQGDSNLTGTGQILGTPSYMPPEQASGTGEVGPRADIYALGAILYCLLTGRPPFQAASPMDTLMQVLESEPVPPRRLNLRVPRDLETISLRCLQKSPARRYNSAKDLADELGRFLRGEPILARPVGVGERGLRWARRNPVVASLLALVLLVLSTGVVVSSWFASQARQETSRAEEQLLRARLLAYAGKLTLAESVFDEGNTALAREHLNDCQWDLQGWEHDHLWTRFDSRHTFAVHAKVTHVAFSPDGARIAINGRDRLAKILDAESGREAPTLKTKPAYAWDAKSDERVRAILELTDRPVTAIAISSDGTRIIAGYDDKMARVFDAETREELLSFEAHSRGVTGVVFSPDGQRMVTSGGDTWRPESSVAEAKVWSAESGDELFVLRGHRGLVTSVAFSPDGARIVTGGYDGNVRVWNAQTGDTLDLLRGHTGPVNSIAHSPDGRRIVTGSDDRTAKTWSAEWGQRILALDSGPGEVTCIAFGADGKRIVTGEGLFSQPGIAKVWDLKIDRFVLVHEVRVGDNGVTSIALSSDGERIITGGRCAGGPEAKIWSAKTGNQILSLKRMPSSIPNFSFNPAGDRIFVGGAGYDAGLADVYDAKTGQTLMLRGHTNAVVCAAFSADGQRIVTGSVDTTAIVWDAESGRRIDSLAGHAADVRCVAFSRDGRRIVTGSFDQTAKVWDAESGREIVSLVGHRFPIASVAFSPDGRRIITGAGAMNQPGEAKIWDTESGQEVFALRGHASAVMQVGFSSDGNRVLTGSSDIPAKIWDAGKPQPFHWLDGNSVHIHTVAFSSDGKRIFAWGTGNKPLAWSALEGRRVDLQGLPTSLPPPSVARSPDGRFTARADGVRVVVSDLQQTAAEADRWPLPDAAERKRYHGEQAAAAEQQGQHFAAAFHLGRLLLDQPDNAELKKRRDEALVRVNSQKTK